MIATALRRFVELEEGRHHRRPAPLPFRLGRGQLAVPHADAAEAERLTSAWLERLMRLKLGHADGRVSDDLYAAGLAAARTGLRDGTAVLVTGGDADYVVALAAAIIGDPVPGDPTAVAAARRAAALLETVVRLKLRRESGELDEEQERAAMAEAGRAIQKEADRLG
ncbi:hypothetical protein ACFPIJ_51905 [Dactylosporangium cerinum]|uniref:NYN domain-containing protein n=1 Tax=Dactylosporangium cerinum TaxID=1434730 RepID=A0ABV9WC77_9ACTN